MHLPPLRFASWTVAICCLPPVDWRAARLPTNYDWHGRDEHYARSTDRVAGPDAHADRLDGRRTAGSVRPWHWRSRGGGQVAGPRIMVSCDVCYIPTTVVEQVRLQLAAASCRISIPQKLFSAATHTHTGPVFEDGHVRHSQEGVMQPAEVRRVLRRAGGRRGGQSLAEPQAGRRGLGAGARRGRPQPPRGLRRRQRQDVRRHDDRRISAASKATKTTPSRRSSSGTRTSKLVAAAINFACTAQEVEGKSTVDADFVHPVRVALRATTR